MTTDRERKEAKKLFTILLENHDTDGFEENELLRLIDCSSIDLLEEFLFQSSTLKQYRALSFIIDEGYLQNCKALMPLLKAIHNRTDDIGTNYFILDSYVELCQTKEDMKYLVTKLVNSNNNIIPVKSIVRLVPKLYGAIISLKEKQLDILASFDKETKYPLYLFDKKILKEIDFFKKEILNKNIIYQEIVFLSAVIRDFSNNELLELVKLSKNTNLIDWYELKSALQSP